jgi:hypothetical protein
MVDRQEMHLRLAAAVLTRVVEIGRTVARGSLSNDPIAAIFDLECLCPVEH